MRKIKAYDQLSVYAQRMLNIMGDPAWAGLECDIWENEDCYVIYNEKYFRYFNIEKLDKALSSMFIKFVTEEIEALDSVDDISDVAKFLILE